MKLRIWLSLAVLLSSNAVASNQIPDVDMHAMTKDILALQKYMFSDAAFLAHENDAAIKSSLELLGKHVGHLSHSSFGEDPSLQTNLEIVNRSVSDAERSFRKGQKSFARYMLLSGTQMCVACHTRTKSADFVLPEAQLPNASTLERANFFYATRQFDLGRSEYEKLVAGFPGNHLKEAELGHALVSLAVYFVRIKDDPKSGQEYFEKWSKSKTLPPELRSDLKFWSQDFSSWAKEPVLPEMNRTETENWKLAKESLMLGKADLVSVSGAKYDVRRLRSTVLLHQILEGPGSRTPIKGEALLALGRLYLNLEYQLYFKYGEMYLKSCITEYSKSNTSRECYKSLKAAVLSRAAGDSEDEVELMKLNRLAN